MGTRRQARILAFQTLFSHEMNPQPLENLLGLYWMDTAEREELKEDVVIFTRVLIKGVLENQGEIDALIQGHIRNWDFRRIGKVDLAILRISVFSLLFQKDIPVKVTIDEAIDISKKFSSDESYRFVNGVLDGIRKDLETQT